MNVITHLLIFVWIVHLSLGATRNCRVCCWNAVWIDSCTVSTTLFAFGLLDHYFVTTTALTIHLPRKLTNKQYWQLHRHQPGNARNVRKIPIRRLRSLSQRLLSRTTRPTRRSIRPAAHLHRQRLLSAMSRTLLPQKYQTGQYRRGIFRNHIPPFVPNDTSGNDTRQTVTTIHSSCFWI